ncbi:D-amino acid dehydrogenase [Dichotomicrobium thermohalophilum]|uniref:D-amino acid dehydrogenase small subunit n=1 Tax=Dichotomicrobium thermohalophilum TaxID=933063 RepID=A0A397Q4G0_9HYPH|nr:D-amino acid dehydrogenase [Dichotomicrobium thermohalophilum]RIA56226.1 D-amino acid dehydrogenase small subunit [Dichotomicrobium thermohalophilum]
MRIIIIGAGVAGVTAAYYLARAGHDVKILDSRDGSGEGTSFANGGQLSYSYVEPMARPELVPKLPRIIAGLEPAYVMTRLFDLKLMRWGMQFLRNCTRARFHRNAKAALALSVESRDAIHALLAEHDLRFDYSRTGKLVLQHSKDALDHAAEMIPLKREAGVEQRRLSREECIALDPALEAYGADFAGGVYAPGDEAGDAGAFCRGLMAVCENELGVQKHTGVQVRRIVRENGAISGLETSEGRMGADHYVLAAGPDAESLARTAGLRLPIYPIKGFSITLPARQGAPAVNITDAANKVVFCRLGERFRVAGFAEFARGDKRVVDARIARLTEMARRLLPDAADYDAEPHGWAGERPMTPDGLPLVGPTRINRLSVSVGHGMFGWTYSCGAGKRLAERIGPARKH